MVYYSKIRRACQVCCARKEKFMRERVEKCSKIAIIKSMIKIWAKVMESEHIARQTTLSLDAEFHYADFFKYLSELCDALDVPTPVLLKTHLFQYAKFRRVVFKKGDFLEEPPFDKLILENIS